MSVVVISAVVVAVMIVPIADVVWTVGVIVVVALVTDVV